MSDGQFLGALLMGGTFVAFGVVLVAIVVAVVLRHRDKADIEAEARRVELAGQQHAKVMDEMRDLKQLTLRAIGGREAMERAIGELVSKVEQHDGRLDEHSGRLDELRERLGLKAEN